ncbi:MAG: T9SS type A sorting domain-containing protein [bacterium]|nr:T9SS type A sorting domain-containing protein [bacterium]
MRTYKSILILLIAIVSSFSGFSQHSVAREWNEALLFAIRNDFARPTVHARNLFHTSVAMYDSWAVYDENFNTYFLGNTIGEYTCTFQGIDIPEDMEAARHETISYAAYRLLSYRFAFSPGSIETLQKFDDLFNELGYDQDFESTDYQTSSNQAAALGNYIAQCIIEFGLQDGSNEQFDYANLFYQPINPSLAPEDPGNPDMIDPNRWQPLALESFIDQSGNEIPLAPEFLSPEWGQVVPFALSVSNLEIVQRDGNDWWLYLDPGSPPLIEESSTDGINNYKWGFSLVSLWSSHLDPADDVLWDISPGNLGNTTNLPTSFDDYKNFYNQLEGGDPGTGHRVNPITGLGYEPQFVPRGDYTRVLAEFWADGPDSETPPGHWFTILNYVTDHPQFERKYMGQGEELSELEWDIKAYLALGGAMHDAAVASWALKGYYDYLRPISAIRYMADQGQSSDNTLNNYSENGIPLFDGLIEVVESGDELAGDNDENVGKIKVYAWKGPDFIQDPETDVAGVGWILAENWWPYQRPTFVTPPFAGFVSGHSTFSRAAAEILTLITGDPYFPGGVGEFLAAQNEFLVFEEGPSVDVVLQWATYRDASDQTSLSRIWGGIHPPADDIPGRLMGIEIGNNAFELANQYFNFNVTSTLAIDPNISVFPNPVIHGENLIIKGAFQSEHLNIQILDLRGTVIELHSDISLQKNTTYSISTKNLKSGLYILKIANGDNSFEKRLLVE